MSDIRAGGCIGCRAHTCLVGVQAALDAPHYARAGEAAEYRLKIKCAYENRLEHGRNVGDVHDEDNKGYYNIQNAHNRNQNSCDLGQTHPAAEYASSEQNCEDAADYVRSGGGIIEAEAAIGGLGVVCSQHIVTNGIGEDKCNCENNADPTLLERVLHIVGRAAVVAAVIVLLLVDLGKGGFNKCRSAAEDSGYPHPEDRTGAAENKGGGNADDIAGTDTGSRGHHECAKGGQSALLLWLLADYLERFTEQTKLY